MTDIADSRNFIQEEETRFRSPVSEILLNRIGAANNFIMNRQRSVYMYEFAGPFRPLQGGEGGVFTPTINQELIGISGYLRQSGASGTTILDMHLIQNDVDQGTQWAAQKLVLPSNGGIVTFFIDYASGSSQATTGVTLPTWSTRDFSAFDTLRLDLDQAASGANDLIINLEYRPR